MDFFSQTSGAWVNFVAVLLGTAIGVGLRNRLPARVGQTLMQVLGLVTVFIALGMASDLGKVKVGSLPGVIVALVSLALGGTLGEFFRLEERLTGLGENLKTRLKGQGRFTEGFVTACLLFCVGPLTIIGSIQNGLNGDMQTTLVKSTLDFISSIALSGVYGIGVGFSALFLILVQGGISLGAGFLSSVLPDPATDPRVLLLSGVGGLLVLGIGINLILGGLGTQGRNIRTAALLPALIIAPLMYQIWLWVR